MSRIGRPAKYGHVENPIIVDAVSELEWKDILEYSNDKYKLNKKYLVSVYCSSKREYLWKWLYKTLYRNEIPFELIVVSQIHPTFELPINFKFIHSISTPIKCMQIASSNCTGEILQLLADDCQSSLNSLDILYQEYKIKNNYKHMIVPNFIESKRNISIEDLNVMSNSMDVHTNPMLRLVVKDISSPIASVGGIISNEFFKELKGYDKRFNARFADLDLQMRAYKAGATVELLQNVWICERKDLCRNDTNKSTYELDWSLWLSLWFRNSTYNKQNLLDVRSDILHEFTEQDLKIL